MAGELEAKLVVVHERNVLLLNAMYCPLYVYEQSSIPLCLLYFQTDKAKAMTIVVINIGSTELEPT
jgi:hypothetical protein